MFDTNMILRYLLNDNAQMADKAEQYIKDGEVYVTIEVIAEVVYVLKGVYSLEREKISEYLKQFLKLVNCDDKEILHFSLDTYAEQNLDFIDCVLYGYHIKKNFKIATFDKKLLNLLAKE